MKIKCNANICLAKTYVFNLHFHLLNFTLSKFKCVNKANPKFMYDLRPIIKTVAWKREQCSELCFNKIQITFSCQLNQSYLNEAYESVREKRHEYILHPIPINEKCTRMILGTHTTTSAFGLVPLLSET